MYSKTFRKSASERFFFVFISRKSLCLYPQNGCASPCRNRGASARNRMICSNNAGCASICSPTVCSPVRRICPSTSCACAMTTSPASSLTAWWTGASSARMCWRRRNWRGRRRARRRLMRCCAVWILATAACHSPCRAIRLTVVSPRCAGGALPLRTRICCAAS